MEANPYAAPQAVLRDLPETDSGAVPFYVVATRKFSVLMIATFGLYSIYWFYRHWHCYSEATGEKMRPVLRGIFSIFFVHRLFRAAEARLQAAGTRLAWQPATLATLYVVLSLLGSMTDALSKRDLLVPWSHFAVLPELLAIWAVLLPAQRALNVAAGDPEGAANATLTGVNIFWLAIGLLWWGLVLVGLVVIAVENGWLAS